MFVNCLQHHLKTIIIHDKCIVQNKIEKKINNLIFDMDFITNQLNFITFK